MVFIGTVFFLTTLGFLGSAIRRNDVRIADLQDQLHLYKASKEIRISKALIQVLTNDPILSKDQTTPKTREKEMILKKHDVRNITIGNIKIGKGSKKNNKDTKQG